MSKVKPINKKQTQAPAIRSRDFGAQVHQYNQWSARVSPETTLEDLESDTYWTHVSRFLKPDDEIRILADDYSFIAKGVVTYVSGSIVKVKVFDAHELEAVDTEKNSGVPHGYHVKMRGVKKWCLGRDLPDGEGIEWFKEEIATQTQAFRELDDHMKAMAS